MINYKKRKTRYNEGQVMLTVVIFFLLISSTIVFGIINPIIKQVYISKNLINSKKSYFQAEGSIEDIVYRIRTNKQTSPTESMVGGSGTIITSTIANTATGKEIISSADLNGIVRKLRTEIILGSGISFHYGVQSGQGGFLLKNSSSITGNVFSGGSVIGSGNYIYGDVISAGASGLIYGIHATGTAFSHTLGSASGGTIIDKDAYYQTKTNTTVFGTSHPGASDQPIAPLPISDEKIAEWEAEAEAGGVISSCDGSGNYTITSTMSLGPKKIACNLIIKSSSAVVTVTGHVWVTGNISFQTGPTVKIAAALGNKNVAIIADDQANSATKGIISIGQSTQFQGSGASGSFVFLISQNNSSETGGSLNAIDMSQGASAMVAYASHGQVTLSQSVSIKEVTAYKIILTQSANVVYDRGLPSTLFSGGPTGGYEIISWKEIE